MSSFGLVLRLQGMHELLAPIVFVLHCDHQAFQHASETARPRSVPRSCDVCDSGDAELETCIYLHFFNFFFGLTARR